jgi:hypothetical protein
MTDEEKKELRKKMEEEILNGIKEMNDEVEKIKNLEKEESKY